MKILPTAFLLLFPLSAYPADWNDISGTYAVTAESLIDPGESPKMDSHYRIQLRGDSARALFEAMKAPTYTDECTGGAAKTVGEMQCVHFVATGEYECHFSINIAEQRIEYGIVC